MPALETVEQMRPGREDLGFGPVRGIPEGHGTFLTGTGISAPRIAQLMKEAVYAEADYLSGVPEERPALPLPIKWDLNDGIRAYYGRKKGRAS
jgi:hypothetical protein